MNLGRGRARRPDDWPSSHVRARSDLSDRLDGALDPGEATWLGTHLGACPDCRGIADAYAAQRLELRALRDSSPPPPRDLWARTAAAIEAEARFRDGHASSSGWRHPRSLLPPVVITAALVVAVVVGTLTSSQRFNNGGDTRSSEAIALVPGPTTAGPASVAPGATPFPAPRKIAYVSRDPEGTYSIKTKNVDRVCPSGATAPCDDGSATTNHPVSLEENPSTVFGSVDNKRLIVVSDPSAANSGSVSVVPIPSDAPASSPPASATASSATPSVTPSGTPIPTPARSPSVAPASPKPTPTPSADAGSPSPSVEVTPQPGGAIEIAHDVVLVGQSAAYSPTGDWFAFTARPVDGSVGPDIFVWKVGDRVANPVTTDHRSVFGSWSGEALVGSTVVQITKGSAAAGPGFEPMSYLLDPATDLRTDLPQTGQAWRPAVDPSGRLAVYWAGTVRATATPGFAPDAGRLVLGDWGTGDSAPSTGPIPTSLKSDQSTARHETTIAAGRLEDWDARWDGSGTHLAVWIADPQNAAVGSLSLYAVDSFDGKIDLKKPLLDKERAVAGYSISDGQLIWAEPDGSGTATGSQIKLLAWTADGVGTVGAVTGPVIVIR
ncbi:MAG: hypothetical protein QOE42_330 [Chloroflexota bacterium]|nr:hypothetical protein [Chloroflexota bacterium]